MYLAAAGVGPSGAGGFCDVTDFTNLQRHGRVWATQDVGRPKVEATKDRIASINPNVKVTTYRTKLTGENVMDIFKEYDIIIDGTDNFPTRYLVNDACVFLHKPNIYGSIFRFEGQATVFWADKGPCYRCLYPEPPPPGMVPSCAEGGVLGILPGTIGLIQATEAVKLILGKGDPLTGRLLFACLQRSPTYEVSARVKLQKDPECPVCGKNPGLLRKLIDYEQFCGIGLGQEEATVETNGIKEITAKELKDLIDHKGKFTLVDVREPHANIRLPRSPDSKLIPLGEVTQRARELDTADDIVVHCRSGARSANAIRVLQKMGFKRLRNLKGGILAWSQDVDPSVPQY